jgi:nicotinic acid mononucleotide adenylyltransferase
MRPRRAILQWRQSLGKRARITALEAHAMDAYDLASLFGHRDALERLDPNGVPQILPFQRATGWRSVALLAGSFNPPTAAHQLLAERALLEGFDGVLFVLAKETLGKARTGLMAEDRLLALRLLSVRGQIGASAGSHGLYERQAHAATRLYPEADIAFLIGSDKVPQIFDDGWYEDRDAALECFFERARLIVAPRASNGETVREILEQPRNRRFADRVAVLPLHPAVSDLSSTRVRGLLQSGAELWGLVPPRVAEFLSEVEAFSPPRLVGDEEINAYELRARLFEALWAARDWAQRAADFRALFALVISATEDGRRMRAALRHGCPEPEELERAQAAAG